MPRPKQKSPEQFIASSPIGEKLIGGVFERNLASGALRLIEINGEPQELSKLGNKEEKIKGTLKSGYFGIIKPEAINPKSKKLESNELYINAEIEGLLIRRDEVPESYFELQRRIARERGYGDFELTDRQKEEDVKRLRADQKESLMRWSGYLRSKKTDTPILIGLRCMSGNRSKRWVNLTKKAANLGGVLNLPWRRGQN